ncbi:hypothetical protein O0880_10505 [Janthinobacterium sp. SUN118]|uniref:hypothetical protein n=1 Tax=Janthinobacterium sp. SUN118 TaxID=3004100 RepID=UPI0025AFF6A3|nr:hypothetical protein [Janthinobacterium sp. SUN118]MDN2709845.1 hypothetical protein [Janthinobacterium sp. SUN118]
MDESTQFSLLLSKLREALSSEVFRTCESLNGHGEWEIALDHCVCHLAQVPLATKMELMACAQGFGSSETVLAEIDKLPCS